MSIVSRGQGSSKTSYNAAHNGERPTVPRLRKPRLLQWLLNLILGSFYKSWHPKSFFFLLMSCSPEKIPPHMRERMIVKIVLTL